MISKAKLNPLPRGPRIWSEVSSRNRRADQPVPATQTALAGSKSADSGQEKFNWCPVAPSSSPF